MTPQFFETKTGFRLTDAEYDWANNIFMLTDNISKEDFCEQFVRLNLINLVRALVALQESELHWEKEVKRLTSKLDFIKSIA